MDEDVLSNIIKDIIKRQRLSLDDSGKEAIINRLIEVEMIKKETVVTINPKEISLNDVLKIMENTDE